MHYSASNIFISNVNISFTEEYIYTKNMLFRFQTKYLLIILYNKEIPNKGEKSGILIEYNIFRPCIFIKKFNQFST